MTNNTRPAAQPSPVIADEGEYQGKPTLTLRDRPETKYPFSFGLGKARLILGAIDQIRAFVAKHDHR